MEAATAPARKVPVMEWRHVAKRYPQASGRALSDVSFVVHPGEIVVLVGPNGSGKTTAMEMVSALRLPTSGEVLVNGEAVRPSTPQRALVGVQLQETGLPQRLKVREAIRAVAGLYADPGPVDEIVAQLGLGPYMTQAVGSLSSWPVSAGPVPSSSTSRPAVSTPWRAPSCGSSCGGGAARAWRSWPPPTT